MASLVPMFNAPLLSVGVIQKVQFWICYVRMTVLKH